MSTAPLANDLVVDEASQLAFASAWVRAYCGWHIAPSITESVTLDTYGGTRIFLPTKHLTALGAVTLTADGSVVDPSTLAMSRLGFISKTGAAWPEGYSAVTVQFTHGYATVPEVVRAACVELAIQLPAQMTNVTAETVGGVSRQFGGKTTTAYDSVFRKLETALENYRIPARP